MQVVRGLASYALPDFLQRSYSPASLTTTHDADDDAAPAPSMQLVHHHHHLVLSPRATQDLIARLDATPTLLPHSIASLVTAASLAARVSLRSSAFFFQLILEASRYSTSAGLGLTRRALVTAVGSARALQMKVGWAEGGAQPEEYLNILDRYTNVGIYLVHHVFTMAELFALAGLNLTQIALSTGFGAAEESVRMFDSLFGSNESSRALSAIIILVRTELIRDPRFSSSLASVVALTKALTAFACLQFATRKRTMANMKMKVVWDATVVAEAESQDRYDDLGLRVRDGQLLAAGLGPTRAKQMQSADESPSRLPSSSNSMNRRSCIRLSDADNQGLVTDLRTAMKNGRHGHESNVDEPARYGTRTPKRSGSYTEVSERSASSDEENLNIQQSLDRLLGAEDTDDDVMFDETPRTPIIDVFSPSSETLNNDHELTPIDIFETPGDESVWEVRTITTRTETTTMTYLGSRRFDKDSLPTDTASTESHPSESNNLYASSSRALGSRRQRTASVREALTTIFTQSKQGTDLTHSGEAICEDEWVEISSRSPLPRRSGSFQERTFEDIPSVTNGGRSGAALARASTIERPEEGRQNLQVILRTMTKRLSQKTSKSNTLGTNDSDLQRSSRASSLKKKPKMLRGLKRAFERSPPKSQLRSNTPDRSPRIIELERSPRYQPNVVSSPRSSTTSFVSEIPCTTTSNLMETPRIRSRPESRVPIAAERTTRTHLETTATSGTVKSPDSVYPPGPLVHSLSKFMRYSSAAYGQAFLRILGLGRDVFDYPDTKFHHSNHFSFASHVGVPLDQILLSSFVDGNNFSNDELSPLVHYVTIDHEASAIVLTARGTLGLSDVLVDLTCEYESIEVESAIVGDAYLAHSGMLHSALRLMRRSSTVHQTLRDALTKYPNYGLVLTGHSLGGGVTALLSVLLSSKAEIFLQHVSESSINVQHPPITTPFVTSMKSGLPPGRPIHCYAFGSPAVASLDLCRCCRGLVTVTVHGLDVVPTLSLGILHDLKNVAVSLSEEQHVAGEVVGRVIGLYQSRRKKRQSNRSDPLEFQQQRQEEDEDVWCEENESRIEMNHEELVAGRGKNLAESDNYHDPATVNPDEYLDEATSELNDWLWSLMTTMRANSDAEKLYPPGHVWHVESFEVFVQSNETTTETSTTRTANNKKQRRLRREARRIILRECEDVVARFSEPIFGRSMFNDHLPTSYELCLSLLEEAVSTN